MSTTERATNEDEAFALEKRLAALLNHNQTPLGRDFISEERTATAEVTDEDDADLEDDALFAQAVKVELLAPLSSRPISDYPDLPIDPKREIRVVSILPGDYWEDICCQLTTQRLILNDESSSKAQAPEGSAPDFEALSYTWGNWNDFECVTLNGVEEFPITYNLWTALKRLRLSTETRRLWIDQLSIDQDSKVEKPDQVALMGLIYNQASEVLIWLGDTPDNGVGMQVNSSELRNQLKHAITWTTPSWFSRSWVLQEFAKATNRPVICFGPHVLDWYEFIASLLSFKLVFEGRKMLKTVAQIIVFDALRKLPSQLDLLELAWTIPEMQCLISQDKIYSLLSLLSPCHRTLIRVDYDSPDAVAFAQATYAEIASSHSLMIMSLATRGTHRRDGFATWAIDLAVPFRPYTDSFRASRWLSIIEAVEEITVPGTIQGMCASFSKISKTPTLWYRQQPHSRAECAYSPKDLTLSIRGLDFDTIGYLCPVVKKGMTRAAIQYSGLLNPDGHHACITEVNLAYERLQHGQKTKSFPASCAWCNRRQTALNHLCHLRSWEKQSKKRVKDGCDIDTISFSNYQSQVYGGLTSAFISGYGFWGMGPPDIEIGDTIVLPYGSRFPMALRPSGHGNTWMFLGLVYVFGIMNGELAETLPKLRLEEREYVLR